MLPAPTQTDHETHFRGEPDSCGPASTLCSGYAEPLADALPAGKQPEEQRRLDGEDSRYTDDGKPRRDVARTRVDREEYDRSKCRQRQKPLGVKRYVNPPAAFTMASLVRCVP